MFSKYLSTVYEEETEDSVSSSSDDEEDDSSASSSDELELKSVVGTSVVDVECQTDSFACIPQKVAPIVAPSKCNSRDAEVQVTSDELRTCIPLTLPERGIVDIWRIAHLPCDVRTHLKRESRSMSSKTLPRKNSLWATGLLVQTSCIETKPCGVMTDPCEVNETSTSMSPKTAFSAILKSKALDLTGQDFELDLSNLNWRLPAVP
ncbi:Aste57867_15923 [Aphanomyces stellatus]|uniref:Aste57867_15923 protein n=1 Tax=Aphanomyces stellatus TaxID=120398 RepID=A0A485L7E1_9STRA|nr:hypothetical protein As57867_015867 [Aphanomyces stellatus]VFT92709.1 Aste57867_15923 [Aphanomyces stellatus]